jgi:hypothetical protein
MRTTITLDDDVFEAAEAQARASGKRLGEVVSELARRGLQRAREHSNRKGLPVFSVPDNAPTIPASRARKLIDEDPA